ncbi:RPGR regulator [Balamuthia mandrillaris]
MQKTKLRDKVFHQALGLLYDEDPSSDTKLEQLIAENLVARKSKSKTNRRLSGGNEKPSFFRSFGANKDFASFRQGRQKEGALQTKAAVAQVWAPSTQLVSPSYLKTVQREPPPPLAKRTLTSSTSSSSSSSSSSSQAGHPSSSSSSAVVTQSPTTETMVEEEEIEEGGQLEIYQAGEEEEQEEEHGNVNNADLGDSEEERELEEEEEEEEEIMSGGQIHPQGVPSRTSSFTNDEEEEDEGEEEEEESEDSATSKRKWPPGDEALADPHSKLEDFLPTKRPRTRLQKSGEDHRTQQRDRAPNRENDIRKKLKEVKKRREIRMARSFG